MDDQQNQNNPGGGVPTGDQGGQPMQTPGGDQGNTGMGGGTPTPGTETPGMGGGMPSAPAGETPATDQNNPTGGDTGGMNQG